MAEWADQPYCARIQGDETLCAGCVAAAQGLNCWEVEASPCCQRSRDTCTDCIVYIGYLRATSTVARVVLGTTQGHVAEGNVYVPAGRRLSDTLNESHRRFLILRDVRWITDPPPGMPSTGVVFIAIQAIAWVAPISEPPRTLRDGPGQPLSNSGNSQV